MEDEMFLMYYTFLMFKEYFVYELWKALYYHTKFDENSTQEFTI